MPYVRRTNRAPYRRGGSTRRSIRGRPAAYKSQRGLYSLTKKVNQMQRKVNSRNHQALFSKQHNQDLTSNYDQFEILVPKATVNETAMTQVFNTDSSILSRSLLKVKEITTIWQVNPNSEVENIDITVTCLAPKSRKVLSETYSPITGALSLVEGTDYVFVDGLALVNKLRWKVHYYKRTTTVAQDGPDNLALPLPGNKGYFKLRNLNWQIKNTVANWDDFPTDLLPYFQRLFMIVFNNNSALDIAFPSFKSQSIIKGLVAQ